MIVASMVKDEMGRFFRPILRIWSQFAKEIVIYDDGSTDGSREEADAFGAHVVDAEMDAAPAWGEESRARRVLFDAAWGIAAVGDYILFLDADMFPARDPRVLMETEADAIAFRLFDLWDVDPLRYREDRFWRGHLNPRVWMVRKFGDPRVTAEHQEWIWSDRGIHSGHLPMNFFHDTLAYAPLDHSLLHLSYIAPELREEKYVRYASVSSSLTEFEREHAVSILDPSPHLVELPFDPEYQVPVVRHEEGAHVLSAV